MTTDQEKTYADGLPATEWPPRRDIRPTLAGVPVPGALQAFMQGNQRMLDQQRRNIQLAESKYELDRVKLIDGYRIRLEDLQHEANKTLHAFDTKHEGEIAESKKLLSLLADVHKAGTK